MGSVITETPALPRTAEHEGLSADRTRVLTLIPIIWILNLLDLLFTLLAYQTREFIELNPLAGWLGSNGQIAFKLAMLAFFTVVGVVFRRRRMMEIGCYVLLAVYGVLAAVWMSAFDFLLSPCYFHQLWAGF